MSKLVAYDGEWAGTYAELAGALVGCLGPAWDIEHVGSTSVPGLCAKPVIDVAIRIPPSHVLQTSLAAFSTAGWTGLVDIGQHRALFKTVGGVRQAIAHLFTADQWETAHVRLFADWLRSHPEDRDAYAQLKTSLVRAGHWGSTFTEGKTSFVLGVVNAARADRHLVALEQL